MLAIFFIAFLMLLTAQGYSPLSDQLWMLRFAAAAAVYSALLCVKRGVNHWPARALWPRMQQPLLATAAARQTSRIAAMNPHMPFLPFFVATLALDFEER